jgi:hypothetical protein
MSKQQTTPANATEVLERITRSMRFADRADAVAYVAEVAQEGFYPAATTIEGITEFHHVDDSTTWSVHVERQTHDGVVTPRYREGQRVIAHPVGMGWEPTRGTLTYVYGHSLKVKLDGDGILECQDFEVDPA